MLEVLNLPGWVERASFVMTTCSLEIALVIDLEYSFW